MTFIVLQRVKPNLNCCIIGDDPEGLGPTRPQMLVLKTKNMRLRAALPQKPLVPPKKI